MSAQPPLNQMLHTQVVALYRQALNQGLEFDDIDAVIGKYLNRDQASTKQEVVDDKQYESKIKRSIPAVVRVFSTFLPLLFLGVGVFLIGNAVVPIAGYYLTSANEYQIDNLKMPIPHEELIENLSSNLVASNYPPSHAEVLSASTQETKPVILDEELDYTNLANWFDGSADLGKAPEQEYSIDIPELDVFNAKVEVGGTQLDKNLIQYPGTAAPGEFGAPVIFGHSVLRQFYNPGERNPRRYNSIFSYIMTLKKGDQIIINRDGAKYVYEVIQKDDVKPEDTYILLQKHDQRLLKLVTCVPEGTYLRRGVITARLVN